MKMHQEKFRVSTRKRFLTQRVLDQWNGVLWEVVIAPSLTEFKEHLDEAFSHII